MSAAPTWTVERVDFVRPDKNLLVPSGYEPPENMVRCIVSAVMADGRRFMNETWVTEEFLAHVGEERVAQMMGEAARLPDDLPPRDP